MLRPRKRKRDAILGLDASWGDRRVPMGRINRLPVRLSTLRIRRFRPSLFRIGDTAGSPSDGPTVQALRTTRRVELRMEAWIDDRHPDRIESFIASLLDRAALCRAGLARLRR